jgi:hypothetical protein
MRDVYGRYPGSGWIRRQLNDVPTLNLRALFDTRRKIQVPSLSPIHRAVECSSSDPKTAHDLFGSTDGRSNQDAYVAAIAAIFATSGLCLHQAAALGR